MPDPTRIARIDDQRWPVNQRFIWRQQVRIFLAVAEGILQPGKAHCHLQRKDPTGQPDEAPEVRAATQALAQVVSQAPDVGAR